MYAVIETGGKQYRVEVGTELEVELLDAEPGKTITLDRVLLVADGDDASIGRPLVSGAEVSAEVLRLARGEKLISFKYRPKARSRVKKGHRQELTVLRISDIVLGGKSAAKDAAKAEAGRQDRARAPRGGRRRAGRQGRRARREAGRAGQEGRAGQGRRLEGQGRDDRGRRHDAKKATTSKAKADAKSTAKASTAKPRPRRRTPSRPAKAR